MSRSDGIDPSHQESGPHATTARKSPSKQPRRDHFKPEDHPNRVNLGCGFDHHEGYLNVDFAEVHEPDLVADIRHLSMLPDSHYVDVLAYDCLEHLERTQSEEALREWVRIMAPGGSIHLRTPNLVAMGRWLGERDDAAHHRTVMHHLFGTQAYSGDYHHTSFTDLSLIDYMASAGLRDIVLEDCTGLNHEAAGRRPEPENPGSSLALAWHPGFHNPEGDESTRWRWCAPTGELLLVNTSEAPINVRIQTNLRAPAPCRAQIPGLGIDAIATPAGHPIDLVIRLDPGPLRLRFECDGAPVDAPADPRTLVFQLVNPVVEETNAEVTCAPSSDRPGFRLDHVAHARRTPAAIVAGARRWLIALARRQRLLRALKPTISRLRLNLPGVPHRNARRGATAAPVTPETSASVSDGVLQTISLDYPVSPRPRWGHGQAPEHPQLARILDAGNAAYRTALESFLPLQERIVSIPLHRDPVDPLGPCWLNPYLPALDGITLYGFTATTSPHRYLEVGSGNSTRFVRRAIKDTGLATRITSIDPFPRVECDELCDEIIRLPLEDCDLGIFEQLEPGDVVFLDGSHRVFTNCDTTVFFLEALPRIPPGVLIGIHDIYLPADYPADWNQRYYAEQYLLAAMLLGGARLDVVLPAYHVTLRPALHKVLAPIWSDHRLQGVETHGGAFWFRVRERL